VGYANSSIVPILLLVHGLLASWTTSSLPELLQGEKSQPLQVERCYPPSMVVPCSVGSSPMVVVLEMTLQESGDVHWEPLTLLLSMQILGGAATVQGCHLPEQTFGWKCAQVARSILHLASLSLGPNWYVRAAGTNHLGSMMIRPILAPPRLELESVAQTL